MDQARMPKDLQEPPIKRIKLASDPHPDLGQSSTASDGDQQASTFNAKPQATNEVSDRSAGKSASPSGSGKLLMLMAAYLLLSVKGDKSNMACALRFCSVHWTNITIAVSALISLIS